MTGITLDLVESFLDQHRRKTLARADLRRAAVLIVLYPKSNELHVLLTKRTEDVEHHKGQISFPGGSVDDGDSDCIATALRETEEETGLPKKTVQVLGLLDEYETPSGFVITPIVAALPSLPALVPNTIEVAEVLEVPLSVFLDKRYERIERRQRLGIVQDVYFYQYGRHEVWGATAAILRAFLHQVRQHAGSGSEGAG